MELKTQQPIQKVPTIQPNLTGIPTQMKLEFERRSGLSFDDVRVHYNSEKPDRFQTDAYTYGTDVYIAPGQNDTLRHELGHVIQQKRGIRHYDAIENGVPVSRALWIEQQADEFGRNTRSEAGSEPLQQPKNGLPVVMKCKRYIKGPKKMEEYFEKQIGSRWPSGSRSTTAYGICHEKPGLQGPHIYPFILWEVLAHSFEDARLDLGMLLGSRLLPYPKTARKILIRIGEEAILEKKADSSVTRGYVYAVANDYYAKYLKLYKEKKWRQLIELNPLHTYSLFSFAGHDQLKGKGERRNKVIENLMDPTTPLACDLQNETQYVTRKSRLQGHEIEKIFNTDYADLSEDSEYSSDDEKD